MTDKPFPKNPYVIGVPLTGDVGFYGRRNIFTFVKDALDAQQQNVIVLYGQRRIGKTSLLHQIAGQLRDEGQLLPVYFDLQGKEQQSLGLVLYSLARTVARPLNIKRLKQDKFDDTGRFFREAFLPSVYEQLDDRRLLLLFDEFDVLGDELSSPEAASETLFPYLQDLIMHQRQIAFIFVVGRRIEELATHFQAIFKQAIYRRIGLLRPEDARLLIVEPVKEILNFEDGAVEAILDLTAGHPYFTQLICFETFNAMKAQNQRVVAQADVLTQIDQAIETGHGALTWFWDGLPRAERFIMSAVAHVTDETNLATKEAVRQILEKYRVVLTGLELKDAPDRLVEWEMLRREGPDNYRFVVELVRRWITKTHPLESARRDVDYISRRAVRLYEIARDAHTEDDLADAREYYQRALEANPNHSGAQLGLAQVLLELGEIETAIEEFTKAYAIDEMSARDGLVRARLAQGRKLEETGQQDEAILQYEQALKISPTDETTRRRLADTWRERSDTALATEGLDASLELFQKVLEFDQSDPVVEKIKLSFDHHMKKAEAERNYAEATRAIEYLRKLLPQDEAAQSLEVAFWTRRGDTLVKEEESEEAVESYERALELAPDDTILAEKLETTKAAWEELLETNRIFNEALIAHQAKDWTTAKAGWQQLIARGMLTHKGHNIANFLSEIIELDKRIGARETRQKRQKLVKENAKEQLARLPKKLRQTRKSLLIGAGILIAISIVVVYSYNYVQTTISTNATAAARTATSTAYEATRTVRNATATVLANSGTPQAASATAQAIATTIATDDTKILFQDDFSSDKNGWVQNDSSGERQIVDGKLRIDLTEEKYGYHSINIPDVSVKDFLFSMDVTNVGNTNEFGIDINFRINENFDRYIIGFWNQRYNISLWQDKSYRIDHDSSNEIKFDKDISNTFVIMVKDSNITIYANGQELTTVTDTTLSEAGEILLTISESSSTESATVELDNLVIKELP